MYHLLCFQKRLDEAALHSERIDDVPYWELAELPDFVVGGILARVGLADKIGGQEGSGGNSQLAAMTASALLAEASQRRVAGSGPPLGSPARGTRGGGSAGRAGAPQGDVSTNSAILEAFLRLSDAAQLHHLRGVGGGGGTNGAAGVVSAAASAAAAAQQKMMHSARHMPWRPTKPFGKAFSVSPPRADRQTTPSDAEDGNNDGEGWGASSSPDPRGGSGRLSPGSPSGRKRPQNPVVSEAIPAKKR